MTKLIELHRGSQWTVLATPSVVGALEGMAGEKKKLRERLSLKRLWERFAANPPGRWPFSDEQVKSEGRFRTGRGHDEVLVLAFKAYQSRLYACQDGKRRHLVLTGHDLNKKRDKADRGALEAAAREFGEWTK